MARRRGVALRYFFSTEVLSVRNEQRGTAEKHKGGKKELISRVGVQAV